MIRCLNVLITEALKANEHILDSDYKSLYSWNDTERSHNCATSVRGVGTCQAVYIVLFLCSQSC